jgi:imidazolonepropionase-like amidohydrolase
MRYRLVGARLFDGIERIIERAWIEVDGGLIAAVEDLAVRPPPEGDDIPSYDLEGLTLLPGLIDAHTHLVGGDVVPGAQDYASSRRLSESLGMTAYRTAAAARQTLQSGVTAVRDLTGRDYLDVDLAAAVEAGILEGPTVRAAGLGLTITGGHVHQRCVEVDGPDEVRKEVRRQIKRGVHWIKLMGVTGGMSSSGRHPLAPQFTLDEIRAATDEAHRAGVRVAAHAHGGEGLTNAIEGGVDTIEHGIFLDNAQAVRMAELGVALVPTLTNEMRYDEALAAGLVPITAHRQRQRLEAGGYRLPSPEERMTVARRNGVRVIAGTDAGGNAMVRHGDTPLELVMLERSGFSAVDALAAATGLAAETIGLDGHGRLAAGARADILVTAEDPTRRAAVLARRENVTAVIKGGNVVVAGAAAGALGALMAS